MMLTVKCVVILPKKDDDERVRCCAAKSLGDYIFFPALVTDEPTSRALTHKTGFNLETLEYGATLTEPWIEGLLILLKDDDKSVRYQAAESLGKNKDERIVKELIKLMIKEGEEEIVAACAAQSLGNIGNILAVEPLIMMVTTVEIDFYLEDFLIALGKIGDKRAFHPLLKEMKDEDSEVREHAAIALGNLGDKRAVKPLIEAMKDDWDEELVSSAAHALGQLGDKRALEPLIESLSHKWDDVRSGAVNALIVLGDERAGKPLVQMLNDNVEYIRGRSAVGLSELGGNHAIKPLTLLLEDSSEWVRDMAESAIDQIQDRIAKKE
jgi:HEAT repeat protein